jgi:hypothetical protein
VRCENCKINVNNLSSNCPLCGRHLPESDVENHGAYPRIGEMASSVYNKNIKALLFLTIVFSISAFLINMLIPYECLWSMIPISAMWLLWLVLGIPIIKRKITPLMIVLDNIVISIFLNIIDVTLDQQGWAMSYVVPFILVGSALAITIIFLLTKIDWKDYYPSQMAIVALCFIPLIIRLFISFIFWPSVVSAAYGFATILGMIILGNKKFKHETKKRFHM